MTSSKLLLILIELDILGLENLRVGPDQLKTFIDSVFVAGYQLRPLP